MSSPLDPAKTVVLKYGGMCLETPERLRAAAAQLASLHARGLSVVVIVSAMGKSTDELVRLAYRVSPKPNRRELDMLLTTGERVSMALMSMALSDLGVPAISFTGSQAGVLTDESHSQARIVDVRPVRVRDELAKGRVVVLAGFQGVNPLTREITTLGRGGSDTTAVAMAAALGGARCEIVKEVDGICTADPRLVPRARPLRELDFAALGEMCFWGAKVLHFRSVELAGSAGVPLVIKRWGAEGESTRIVKEVSGMEIGKILSVNSHARVEHLEIASASLNEGFEKLGAQLRAQGLTWPQVLASAFEGGATRLMMTGDGESLDALFASLAPGFRKLRDTMASVSLTCYGAVASDLPLRALQTLSAEKLTAEKFLLTPHSVTFVVAPAERERAVQALHALI